jgi:ATP-dependent Zn protease
LAARKSASTATDDTPPLDKLPGLSGEARVWGEDLVANFARWRAGEIPWRALSASAIFAGPPGTGKTLFAKALARSLAVALHVTSVGTWFATSDGCLGGVTQAMQGVWDRAIADARAGGALLLVDELDALPDRATMDSRAREWWSSLVAHALTLFDGAATSREGLILVGATNFGTRLDAALVRPGRFDRVIEIPLPSVDDLVAVLQFHLDGALAGVDLKPIVQLGSGATPAVAAGWARGARARAAAARRDLVVNDLVSVVAPNDDRSDADVRRASVHEAGHFVVAADLGRHAEAVSIIVAGSSGGRTRVDTLATVLPTARDLDLAVIIALAGRAAEEVALGAPSVGAESDLAAATAALASAHASAGLGRSLVHVAPSQEAPGLVGADPALRRIVDRHLARLYLEAKRRVERRLADVERVADALQARRFLAADELRALLAQAPGRSRRKKEGSP